MHEMRKASAALIVLMLLIVLLLPFAFRYGANPHASLPVGNETPSKPLYILYAQEDHLVLLSRDSKEQRTLHIDPRTLPPHDQNALREGIPLESERALDELLQDFGS